MTARILSNLCLLGGLSALGTACAVASAETPIETRAVMAPSEPEPAASINVLPADMDGKERFALMKHISMSLGVRCTYCHVGEEGQPLSTFDFKSDEKAHKREAREMLKLTYEINKSAMLPGEGEASLTDMSRNRVTCYTCHRGESEPATNPPPPDA